MNEVLREFFKEEIKAGEERARNEGVQEGRLEGREECRIETLYTDCNMSVPDIAKKVSKSEEYVREIIKKNIGRRVCKSDISCQKSKYLKKKQ